MATIKRSRSQEFSQETGVAIPDFDELEAFFSAATDDEDDDDDEEEEEVVHQDVLIRKNIMIPMRDGVKLASDLYFPDVAQPTPNVAGDLAVAQEDGGSILLHEASAAAPPKFSCVLIRTPYNKAVHLNKLMNLHDVRSEGEYWTKNGYACLIQDCRGRFASEGTFYKYICEAEDGFDTVAWIAEQEWSDGNVGTLGVSYLCHVQTSMAVLRPPALKAMFCVKGGFFNAFHSGVRQGGALEFRQWVWAYKKAWEGEEAKADPLVKTATRDIPLVDWLARAPFTKGFSPVARAPSYEGYMYDMSTKSTYSEFWKQVGLNTQEYLEEFADVPTTYMSGWYDIYARSAVDFFTHLHPRKKGPIHLIMGPWDHHGEKQVVGEVDFGAQALISGSLAPDLWSLKRLFFDCHLRGLDPGDNEPPVRYFRMGGGPGNKTKHDKIFHGGKWMAANTFPPEGVVHEKYFLKKEGGLAKKAKKSGAMTPVKEGAEPMSPGVQDLSMSEKTFKGDAPPTDGPVKTTSKRRAFYEKLFDGLSLSQDYVSVFVDNELDKTALRLLIDDENALKELVPMLGDRLKIKQKLKEIAALGPNVSSSSFTFDPADPVPSIGGNTFTYDKVLFPGPYNQWERPDMFMCKPTGCLPLACRHDVLSFVTKPLKNNVDVTGVVKAVLFVSSSCVDTDFTIKLIDECPPTEGYPHGFSMNITHGIQRCRFRDGYSKEVLMVPGKVYRIEVECYPTSNLFKKGHRIRVDVSSSNFPHFDVNPNTGEPLGTGKRRKVAENTVYHDAARYASYVSLPVLPDKSADPQMRARASSYVRYDVRTKS